MTNPQKRIRLPDFWRETLNIWIDKNKNRKPFTLPQVIDEIFNYDAITKHGGKELRDQLIRRGFSATTKLKGGKWTYNRNNFNLPAYEPATLFFYSEAKLADPPSQRPLYRRPSVGRVLIPTDWKLAVNHALTKLKTGEPFTIPQLIESIPYLWGLRHNSIFKKRIMDHLIFIGVELKSHKTGVQRGGLAWLDENEIRRHGVQDLRGLPYRETMKFRKPTGLNLDATITLSDSNYLDDLDDLI